MKIIRELTEEEAKSMMPDGLVNALNADPTDVEYCMICDGLRVKGHRCISCIPSENGEDGYYDPKLSVTRNAKE